MDALIGPKNPKNDQDWGCGGMNDVQEDSK